MAASSTVPAPGGAVPAAPGAASAAPPSGDVRARIATAARELFAAQGYEHTTVETIAERAGVSRRTFFRHFPSKDDAVFPDHEQIARTATAHLATLSELEPLAAVCRAVTLVFATYTAEPSVAVQRYALARTVPALKDREIAGVSRYTRLFSRYLRERLGEGAGIRLYADVVAAAVVAAHNEVLRAWLRGGGVGDPGPELQEALAWVAERFDRPPPGAGGGVGGSSGEDVVVAVFRSGAPLDDVVQRISRTL